MIESVHPGLQSGHPSIEVVRSRERCRYQLRQLFGEVGGQLSGLVGQQADRRHALVGLPGAQDEEATLDVR